MKTFLEQVAQDILSRYGHELSRIAVVFPNKRASLFLNRALASLADGPIWSPAYITISEFFRQHSQLTVADPVKSLCDLYKSYNAMTGRGEELDEFYGWGQLLLADFDDIDKNMADAGQVFRNVRDIHELDDADYLTQHQKEELQRFFANFTGDTTVLRERFITLWSKLSDVYADFRSRLRSQGLAYEGMLYREVAEQQKLTTQYEHYVFVGFNVLQKVEQQLFGRLQSEGKASFYWDYDHYYLNGTNEAGVYIRQWLEKFPNALDAGSSLFDSFAQPKNVRFVSAPTENLQARYITQWLREDERYKDGRRTAIVLCDESLLHTAVHCIPDEVEMLNVTTGYPLQQTPIASMVSQLLTLQTDGYSMRGQAFRLHNVNRVLRHPYGRFLTDRTAELLRRLNAEKQFYVTCKDDALFTYLPHGKADIPRLAGWLAACVRRIAVNGADNGNPLFEESVFRMYTLLTRLSGLMEKGDLEASLPVFRRLLGQLISSTNIPFHGEPARGVQLMGVLETRNLDFDHVLILSCNEGNMPKGVSDTSFIPHVIRKAYGLTTIDNKVAVYSYYFHSLIQRAKDVTILYNNSTQGSQTGEMSRFMLQLLVEFGQPIGRFALQAGQEPMQGEALPVAKEEVVMDRLADFTTVSPTALNTYLRCQLRFFYKYIAGLNESDDTDEDDIDSRVFGNIFHRAAQLLYERLLPREVITAENIEYVLKTGKSAQPAFAGNATATIDTVIDEAFAVELFKLPEGTKEHPKLNGLQLISHEVIAKYLRQLLRTDLRVAPLRVIQHEFDVFKQISIDVCGTQRQITVGGRVDRLDEVNLSLASPRLRVVDYKTGNSVSKPLKTVEELFDSKKIITCKADYQLQSLLYSLLVSTEDVERNPDHHPVSPALLFIQHAGAEDYSPVLTLNGDEIVCATDYAEEFYRLLRDKLSELYNPDIPFAPTDNVDACTYCPYRQMCGR
ncbi:PD-(D/E)XK nuclease family protein [Prevotella dentasini]|uniref:PD-(D/E)XK nuclease family protein n=1 Tax=Prevotella dentasini TaxID=589537 RepID=UPI000469AE9D|nr:PD-(D/E)XK nuclease family protein [Prevotella dentasini]